MFTGKSSPFLLEMKSCLLMEQFAVLGFLAAVITVNENLRNVKMRTTCLIRMIVQATHEVTVSTIVSK
jgi:hypothetical protein